MQNNTNKYREQTIEAMEIQKEQGGLDPVLTANAFPLKVNGDERFVIRIGLAIGKDNILAGEGTAVHNPVDDFDPGVGILLASSRAYADYAKHLREVAYKLMMRNALEQKVRAQYAKDARRVRNIRKSCILGRQNHRVRLLQALDDGRVFYCPECNGHFGNNKRATQRCPHCGLMKTRQYWHVHRLDEWKEGDE